MGKKTVWVIRHTESESNESVQSDNPQMVSLTSKGHAQAKHISNMFYKTPNLVITSNYLRTKLTAKPTLDKFSNLPQQEWPIHEFNYLKPFNNHHALSIKRHPKAKEYWKRSDPHYLDGDGAESFANMIHRVSETLTKLKALNEEFTAMFCHALFMKAMLWIIIHKQTHIDTNSMKQFRAFQQATQIPNGCIVELEIFSHDEVVIENIFYNHFAQS